jgi:hypothetical protein
VGIVLGDHGLARGAPFFSGILIFPHPLRGPFDISSSVLLLKKRGVES